MAYIKNFLGSFDGVKAYRILTQLGYTTKEAQRLCDKGRLSGDGDGIFAKSDLVFGAAYLLDYELNPKGLKPVYENEFFAAFNKPSGVLSHPNGRHCEYSLCDEIWSLYGRSACVAHRLDKETSGAILVAKTPAVATELKRKFEAREVQKSYLALIDGEFDTGSLAPSPLHINERFGIKNGAFMADMPLSLASWGGCKMRMEGSFDGKSAVSVFEVVAKYDKNGAERLFGCKVATQMATLIKCYPLTGRQHQLRVHLYESGNRILGDSIYGLDKAQIEAILDDKMSEMERVTVSGASRLMLHSKSLEFRFNNEHFNIEIGLANFGDQNRNDNQS